LAGAFFSFINWEILKTEMSVHTIIMFLKFGNQRDVEDLLLNGTIYMNPVQFFRKLEDEELRGDKYEGVSRIWNWPPGEFEIPAIGYKGKYISLHLKESYEQVLGNIYSLYCISSRGWSNPDEFSIDKRVSRFGSHCLMIKDIPKFLSLIESHLQKLHLKYVHGFVDYYDREAVNRRINLFEKPLEFEYQKEFRFYVDREASDKLVFQLGSLENIAEIQPSHIIVDQLKLTNLKS
jgi:hypothetical protein